MDEATIAVWTQIGALIVQIVAIGIAFRAFKHESHHSQALLSIELLLKLEEQFNSDTLRKARAKVGSVAIRVLEGRDVEEQDIRQMGVSIDEVLNLFEMLGLMVKQEKLDKQYAYFQFSYWLKPYYNFAHDYISATQEAKPQQWEHVSWIHAEFLKMEPSSSYPLSEEDLNHFFDSESKLIPGEETR
jgi:hypothetical protein